MERKLNLGSGPDELEGYIALDRFLDSSHHAGTTAPPDIQADAHHLPIKESSLDALRASHVIEHLERPLDALRECRRAVRPGGTIYIEVPDPSKQMHERDDHLYSWSKDTLKNIVRAAGFEIKVYEKNIIERPSGREWGHHVVGRKPQTIESRE